MSIIDGKAVAQRVRAEVKHRAEAFRARQGRPAGLEVIIVGDDPASQVYVKNKEKAAVEASIRGVVHRLPKDTSERALLDLIDRLNADRAVDGILLQLPLPEHLVSRVAIERIDPSKDVDGLHPANAGLLMLDAPGLRPCTPLGCMRLLEETGTDAAGKQAIVIGRSHLVGKPLALMLLARHATVTMAHSRTKNLESLVQQSEIVVAAAGRPNLVRGNWVREGAIVLDVGINRLPNGKLVGDVEFEEAAKRAAWITPVPGGIGPMTIAMLLNNTIDAAEHALG